MQSSRGSKFFEEKEETGKKFSIHPIGASLPPSFFQYS
jgi:hypothetical protein